MTDLNNLYETLSELNMLLDLHIEELNFLEETMVSTFSVNTNLIQEHKECLRNIARLQTDKSNVIKNIKVLKES